MRVSSQTFVHDYFSANTSIDRGWVKNGVLAAWRTFADTPAENAKQKEDPEDIGEAVRTGSFSSRDMTGEINTVAAVSSASSDSVSRDAAASRSMSYTQAGILPHRRRKLKREQKQSDSEPEHYIPPDASSQLTTAATNLPKTAALRRNFATYLSLAKPRLSFLIVLTTATAYSLYPIPDIISSTTSLAPTTLSTSTLTLLFLTAGTFLSCASANTLNMMMEPKSDALMSRTRNRPLVRNLISPRAAGLFALVCGTVGLVLLDLGTNSTVAGLSALNIFLYAGVYTPMKRISVFNTWVGAVVGAIPPMMGWVAAAGQAATSEHHSYQDLLFSESSIGGWCLAGLLFAWQFPHFNALSHAVRFEYRDAGLRMLAWANPAMNARVALRYSVAMFPLCFGLWWTGVVDSGFLAISTVLNVWMTKEAVNFWKKGGAGGSARGLFWASVWHLPLVMVGALICKKGIWDGLFPQRDLDEEVLQTDRIRKSKASPENYLMGFKRPS